MPSSSRSQALRRRRPGAAPPLPGATLRFGRAVLGAALGLLLPGLGTACAGGPSRSAPEEGAGLPIEVTVEHPVDSPGAAALADPCPPPPG